MSNRRPSAISPVAFFSTSVMRCSAHSWFFSNSEIFVFNDLPPSEAFFNGFRILSLPPTSVGFRKLSEDAQNEVRACCTHYVRGNRKQVQVFCELSCRKSLDTGPKYRRLRVISEDRWFTVIRDRDSNIYIHRRKSSPGFTCLGVMSI